MELQYNHLDISFVHSFFFNFKKFFKVIHFWERESQSMSQGGAEREGERESQAGSALSAQSLMQGLNSQSHEIVAWTKIKSHVLMQLSHPCAPVKLSST